MKIIINEDQLHFLTNTTTINGVDIYSDFNNIEENKKIGLKLIINEVNKFKSSEELLRSGGFSDLALDLSAFGFTEESVTHISPEKLTIKWKDDMLNVVDEVKRSKKSKLNWSHSINLKEPIDVSFNGKKFFIEDGHHRYYAAKILNKKLNVNLEIKANPILSLSYDDYDTFHRSMFNKFYKK